VKSALIRKLAVLSGAILTSFLMETATLKAQDGFYFITPGSPMPNRPRQPQPGQVAINTQLGGGNGKSSGGTITNTGSSVNPNGGSIATGIINAATSLPLNPNPTVVSSGGGARPYAPGQVALSIPAGAGTSSGGTTTNSGSSVNTSTGQIVGGLLNAGFHGLGGAMDSSYSLTGPNKHPLTNVDRKGLTPINVAVKKPIAISHPLPKTNANPKTPVKPIPVQHTAPAIHGTPVATAHVNFVTPVVTTPHNPPTPVPHVVSHKH
jgi:hypothetical protein